MVGYRRTDVGTYVPTCVPAWVTCIRATYRSMTTRCPLRSCRSVGRTEKKTRRLSIDRSVQSVDGRNERTNERRKILRGVCDRYDIYYISSNLYVGRACTASIRDQIDGSVKRAKLIPIHLELRRYMAGIDFISFEFFFHFF